MSPGSDRPTRIRLWLVITACCVIVAAVCHFRPWLPRGSARWEAMLANRVPGEGLYVVEKSCAECHAPQAASHASTTHARTFHATAQWELGPALDGKTFQDTERGYEYHYHFDPQVGLSVTVPGKFDDDSFPLTYALGSGQHAVTFLTLIPSRAATISGVEHRVSIYPSENGFALGLTPGHQGEKPQQDVEYFGRFIKGETLRRCIECHTTRGEIVGQEISQLAPSIGCQQCHGPGREHVIAVQGFPNKTEPPQHGPKQPADEQIRACTGCHLQGEREAEIAPLKNHIRSVQLQAAELLQSKCYEKSANRLSCAMCHDPHEPISRDGAHYVERCAECHRSGAVICPVAPGQDCLPCHMAPVKGADGINRHDHRIQVRK